MGALINLNSRRNLTTPIYRSEKWKNMSEREYIFLIYAACVQHYSGRKFELQYAHV